MTCKGCGGYSFLYNGFLCVYSLEEQMFKIVIYWNNTIHHTAASQYLWNVYIPASSLQINTDLSVMSLSLNTIGSIKCFCRSRQKVDRKKHFY